MINGGGDAFWRWKEWGVRIEKGLFDISLKKLTLLLNGVG